MRKGKIGGKTMKNTENPVLQTEKLCKSYGHVWVPDEVRLSVERGSIYGMIGENGAGKTTLFRVIAGPAPNPAQCGLWVRKRRTAC